MFRLTRALSALSCISVLVLGLNLVITPDPQRAAGPPMVGDPKRLSDLQSAGLLSPRTNGVLANVNGVRVTIPAPIVWPQTTAGSLSNAFIRENPDPTSGGFALVPVSSAPSVAPQAPLPSAGRPGRPNRPPDRPDRPPLPPNTTPTKPTSTLPSPPTTQPSTTTTILTTTTRPSPATTVPAPPAGVIPATITHPGINGDNGYRIGVTAKDPERGLWQAPYLYEVPYLADSGWLAGDRIGYRCAYGFLHHEGEIIGRFTFRRIEAAEYIVVNDTYMSEGERYYDGSPTGGIQQVPDFECPVTDQSYQTVNAPDEDPLVVYWSASGQAVELRDYRGVVPGPGVTFHVVEVINQPFSVTAAASGTHTVTSRVTVLARENGVAVAVVYYDGLGSGHVTGS